MATIVPKAWRLTSKTVLASGQSAVKKARRKKKSKPRSPTFNLHFRMANCNTAQKRRGLKTHPCRTPPVMLKFLLRPDDPMTSPNCPSYNCFVFLIIGLRYLCHRRYVTTAGLSQLEFPLLWQILEAELRQIIIFDKERAGVFV